MEIRLAVFIKGLAGVLREWWREERNKGLKSVQGQIMRDGKGADNGGEV